MSEQTVHNDSNAEITKSRTSLFSSFWFVIILVFLFIAAINFVNIMANDNGEGNKITDVPKVKEAPREATASETLKGESGEGKVVDTAHQTVNTADTAVRH